MFGEFCRKAEILSLEVRGLRVPKELALLMETKEFSSGEPETKTVSSA